MPITNPTPTPLEPTPLSGLKAGVQLLPLGVCAIALMCSGFTVTASLVLCVALSAGGLEEEPGFYLGLGLKAVLFGVLAALSAVALRRMLRTFPPRLAASPLRPTETPARFAVAGVMLFFAILVLPKLSTYPWTAPDELHHLIVARNLSEYGTYASGHPDSALIRFDPYDSVGPPVLVPVAAAFSVAGTELIAARMAMAGMFLIWLGASWLLLRPVFGDGPAAAGIALAGTAVGSIYLGRTLYGEVPALMYAAAGLLYWRTALGRVRHELWSILAGACFGFAVLSKTVFALAVFAVLAAYVFDRFSYRRIPLSRVLWPGVAAAAVFGAWSMVASMESNAGAGVGGTLLYYRHSLMFGLGSLDETLGWLIAHWSSVVLVGLGFVSALPVVLLVRYDAPTLVLLLIGALFGYWWLFFTTGQIPRYLWFSLAIGGLFAGPLLANALGLFQHVERRLMERYCALALVVLMLTPAALELRHVGRLMWLGDEMADEYALQDFLRVLPRETNVETTSWMLQRSANFFSNRSLTLIAPDQIGAREGYVLRDRALEEFDAADLPAFGRGRYRMLIPPEEGGSTP